MRRNPHVGETYPTSPVVEIVSSNHTLPEQPEVYICIKAASCPRCNGRIDQKRRWWGPSRSPQCSYSPILQSWEPGWQPEILGMDDHMCITALALFDVMIDVTCQDHVIPTWPQACRYRIYLCNQPAPQNCGAGRILNSLPLLTYSSPTWVNQPPEDVACKSTIRTLLN